MPDDEATKRRLEQAGVRDFNAGAVDPEDFDDPEDRPVRWAEPPPRFPPADS